MKILLTGGTGFLGSAVINRLSPHTHIFTSFDNLSRKSHIVSTKDQYETYIGDVRNMDDLQAATKNQHFDAIWHFAYINGTKTFYSDPALVLDVGVKGAINTLDVAINNGIKNYILCSTSEVYNEPSEVPTTEQERILIPDIHNPRFSYSGGKIISELLTIHYGTRRGLNTKIFRPHNVYGPNMGFEHVIPELIKKILLAHKGNKIVSIQGSGDETRAFCYVDDAADQMALVANDVSENASIYNIGTENEISIRTLATMIADIMDIEVEIVGDMKKPAGGTNRRCPSMTKINKLGGVQEHNLFDGLSKTVEWYQNHFLNIERIYE